jgi:hypothetical protein
MSKRLKRHPAVESAERECDGNWWIELKRGWTIDQAGCHCFGADDTAEAISSLSLVVPCQCKLCKDDAR